MHRSSAPLSRPETPLTAHVAAVTGATCISSGGGHSPAHVPNSQQCAHQSVFWTITALVPTWEHMHTGWHALRPETVKMLWTKPMKATKDKETKHERHIIKRHDTDRFVRKQTLNTVLLMMIIKEPWHILFSNNTIKKSWFLNISPILKIACDQTITKSWS